MKSQQPLILQVSEDWVRLQELVQNSVVQVIAQVGEFNWLEPYKLEDQYEQRGTGFFIDERGTILTNAHVVDQAATVWVHLPALGKQPIAVDIIGFCPDRDVALLRIKPKDLKLVHAQLGAVSPLPLGDSDVVQRTEHVLVLGYPLGHYGMKSSTGVVSGRESAGVATFIQITAPINPGNSGGPLLDGLGQVIGIAVANVVQAQNIGYAIPINEVKMILDDLYRMSFVRRPILGARFNYGSDAQAEYLGNPLPSGFYVNKVFKGSLFDSAGIKEGDMIYEFNGFKLDAFGDAIVPWSYEKVTIHDLIARLRMGDTVVVVLYRDGKRKKITFNFNLTDLYAIRAVYPAYEKVSCEIIGGMVFMNLTDNHLPVLIAQAPYLMEYTKMENKVEPALVVTHLVPGSLAQQTRTLEPGTIIVEVNNKKVQTLEQLRDALPESLKTGFLTIKTSEDVFVVLPFKQMLEDEERLSRDFSYPMSSVVIKMLAGKKKHKKA